MSIIGAIIAFLLGIWLIFAAFHIIFTILGWILVIAAVVVVIQYLVGSRNSRL